jgi:hypothetical protein
MIRQLFAPYPWFKLAILGLLSLNVLIYAIFHNPVSAVDALSWVLLLVMFELETFKQHAPFNSAIRRSIRNGLILIIAAVFCLFVQRDEWLDISNSILWFMLIALLELEIRYPQTVEAHLRIYWLATLLIFIGLIVMIILWLANSAWLDAYDALLWIVAFAVIDVDIYKFLQFKGQ